MRQIPTLEVDVPKGEFPLKTFADLGEQTLHAGSVWGPKVIKNLRASADQFEKLDDETFLLAWNATLTWPRSTIIFTKEHFGNYGKAGWYRPILIACKLIAFHTQSDDRSIDFIVEIKKNQAEQ